MRSARFSARWLLVIIWLAGIITGGASTAAAELEPAAVEVGAASTAPVGATETQAVEIPLAEVEAAAGNLPVAAAEGGGLVYQLRPEPYSDAAARVVTLEELLELAVNNNLALGGARLGLEKGHYTVDQTYYAFDPTLSGSLSFNRRKSDNSTAGATTGSTSTDSYSLSTSYSVPREYGDAFSFSYDLSRADYSLPAGSTGSSESYGSGFSVGYARPLLRGAGRRLNRIQRYTASNSLLLAYDKLDDDIRKLKKNVLDTYFTAVAAREGISVREASLELALKQLERVVERYKVGLAIQSEVLQAENSVLTQRSALLSARNVYAGLLDTLTTLVGLPEQYELTVNGETALIQITQGTLPDNVWELVQTNSYELKSLNTQLANLQLGREQLVNQLEPKVDLSLNYGRAGQDENLGPALGGYENESYGVRLDWSLKPGERSTKAEIAQSDLDLASLDLSIQDVELQLKTSLRSRQRDLETKYQQIGIAESNLHVVRETYNIMLERNNVGLATTLDVIEAEEKVLGAELSLLQARVDYQQAYREILLLAGLL